MKGNIKATFRFLATIRFSVEVDQLRGKYLILLKNISDDNDRSDLEEVVSLDQDDV